MELHYVHGKNVDNNDPILRKIIEFCSLYSLEMDIRPYSPYKYDEDREFVARLPAIQLYKHKSYQDTFYPDFKPIQLLTLEVEKYQLEELEKETKKQIWEERIKYLKSMFRSLKTDSNGSNQDRK
jgi:hypothetical protein